MAVLLTAILIGLTASVEANHAAFAADSQTPVEAAPQAAIPVTDLAAARQASLQVAADSLEAQQQLALLAEHEKRKGRNAASIRSEVDRLKNLARFAWPTSGGVSSGFGMRKHPILGYTRLHNGVDMGGGRCGNPIYAAQSGTVTRASYSSSAGNNVRVNHGTINGKTVETAYLHMSKYAVKARQKVNKGDLIGYVGTTGLSTGCHLHLALYENGQGSDPLAYLTRD